MIDNSKNRAVGLVGLGLVGTQLAQRFMENGFVVSGYDIDVERCRDLQERGVRIVDSIPDIAKTTERVVLSLPNSAVVHEVVLGREGLLSGRPKELLIVDTTTGDPQVTLTIAELVTKAGCAYMDACIVGSSRQVAEGDTTVIVGGARSDVERCRDLLETFSREIFHVGAAGKGCEAKLVVNLVLGLNRLVLAEGLSLAEALGLNLREMLDVLKAGAAYSKVMDVKGEKMIAADFEPQARLAQHFKDVELILKLGEKANINLPLSELHHRVLQKGIESGFGSLDNSAVLKVLRERLLDSDEN